MRYCFVCIVMCLPLSMVSAQQAESPKSRLISFEKDTITLQDALKAFQQADVTVTADESLGNPMITLSEKKLPFWPMLDQIADAIKAQPSLYTGRQTIALRPRRAELKRPTGYDGIFRTSLKQISLTRYFGSNSLDYHVTLELAWEPGFVPLYLRNKLKNVTVKNDAVTQKLAETGGSWQDVTSVLATDLERVTIPALKKNPLTLDLLEGDLLVRGATRMTTLDFGPLNRAVAAGDNGIVALGNGAKNPVACVVSKPILSRRRWSIPVELRLPKNAPTFESFQSWISHNEIWLENTKTGQKLYSNTERPAGNTNTPVVRITYNFTDPARGNDPADWTLHYRLPVNVVAVPIRVSIKNVSLTP